LRLCRNRKNAHRTHTNIHASVGFEPTICVGVGENSSCLRKLGHCDRLDSKSNKK
jgi:hypothetical protein